MKIVLKRNLEVISIHNDFFNMMKPLKNMIVKNQKVYISNGRREIKLFLLISTPEKFKIWLYLISSVSRL
jgi:hypothetical protein